MAKLPSATDLNRRQYQASSPGIRVRAPDFSPIAEGVARAAKGLEAVVQAQDEVDDYDTRKRLLDFKLTTEMELEESSRNMIPGGAGFTGGWQDTFRKRAKEFVGKDDANIPAAQRGKVGLWLKQHEVAMAERAQRYEIAERDREHVDGLETQLGTLKDVVGANPTRRDEMAAEGRKQIELSRIPAASKHRLLQKYEKELDRTQATSRILSLQTPEDMEAFRGELRLDQEDLPPAVKWRVFDKDTPTASERRKIASEGGIVVNLDTNWAPAGRTTEPMVVIPDNATPQQRQAAEDYAARIADLYNEKFGTNVKPKVLTRSQNGRGRNDTIHTEPFSVNDVRAVDFFSSEEGRGRHAEIIRETFGSLPGVAFSLPHDPTRKGDRGAVGPRGSEVDLAAPLLAELSRTGVPTPELVASTETPVPRAYKNLTLMERKTLWGQAQTAWKERLKEMNAIAAQERVDGWLSGAEEFNPMSKEGRKLLDDTLAMSNISDRIFSGDYTATTQGVALSQRLRYAPAPVAEGITGLIKSGDNNKMALGYSAVVNLLHQSPNALDQAPGHEQITRDALKFQLYSNRYGGPVEALKRMAEDNDPEKARVRKVNEVDANKFVKDEITEDTIRVAMSRGTLGDWWNRPETALSHDQKSLMIGEFKDVVRREYELTGDKDLAIKLATQHFQKRHGVSEVLGKRVMAYPPESFWPPVAGSYDYMKKDIQSVVGTYGPDAVEKSVDLKFAGFGRDGKPNYWITWQRQDGRLEMAPRPWVPGVEDAARVSDAEWQERRRQKLINPAPNSLQDVQSSNDNARRLVDPSVDSARQGSFGPLQDN